MVEFKKTSTAYRYVYIYISVILIYGFFLFFKLIKKDGLALFSESLIMPVITIIYLICIKNKNILLTLFFIFYALSDFYSIIDMFWRIPFETGDIYFGYQWYVGTGLCIISYFVLLLYIFGRLDFNIIIRKFKLHIIVLTILNIYLVYVMQNIIEFNLRFKYTYYFEFVYNIILAFILSLSLLNFSSNQSSNKSLYLFLGSLFIIFSEVIDIAYQYIEKEYLIDILGTTLSLIAFYFYFEHSRLLETLDQEKEYMID